MKKTKTIKFPTKAKLITDGGFYKFIEIKPKYTQTIIHPLKKRITVASPETNIFDMGLMFDVEFGLEKVYKNYAQYRQINVTISHAK
jgi:hypothetical protein